MSFEKGASNSEEIDSCNEVSTTGVEEAANNLEMDSHMKELHSLLTRTVEQSEILEPNEFIVLFKKIESMNNISGNWIGTKLGILVRIFEKYLMCRLPNDDVTDELESSALNFVGLALVSESCKRVQDFTINDLWKLVLTAYNIRTKPCFDSETVVTWSGKTFSPEKFATQVFKKISYLGEFLYYCASNSAFEFSPLADVKHACTVKEIELIDEVKNTIKPELGIATLIVGRSWTADIYKSLRDDIKFWMYIKKVYSGYQSYHNAYCKDLEQIEKYELLKVYFMKFILFLGSEASSAHRYFDLSVLKSQDYFSGFKNMNHFMELDNVNKFLIKIFKFFVEGLLYLHNEKENTVDFKDLPLYFKHKWNETNTKEYSQMYLTEAVHLLDFVFVYHFKNEFSEEFHRICTDISDIAIDKFIFPPSIVPITRYCLFPFFGVNNKP